LTSLSTTTLHVALPTYLRSQLHHTHTPAQGIEHTGHFQPDDAAAHHQQTARELRQLERVGRVEDSRILRPSRQARRFGTRGNDALIEADTLRAARAHHFEHVGAHEASDTVHHLHLALLHQDLESPGQLCDDCALPGSQPRQINLPRAE